MVRSVALAMFVVPLMSACTHASVAAPVASAHASFAPVALSYRLLRTGDGEGALLTGHTEVDAKRGARIHTSSPDGASEKLEISSHLSADGSLAIGMYYEERSADGHHIEWRPEVRVARGVPAKVNVAGAGWGRTLELSVD